MCVIWKLSSPHELAQQTSHSPFMEPPTPCLAHFSSGFQRELQYQSRHSVATHSSGHMPSVHWGGQEQQCHCLKVSYCLLWFSGTAAGVFIWQSSWCQGALLCFSGIIYHKHRRMALSSTDQRGHSLIWPSPLPQDRLVLKNKDKFLGVHPENRVELSWLFPAGPFGS